METPPPAPDRTSVPAAPAASDEYLSSVAERAAMIAVVVAPALGGLVKWFNPGWMAMMSLLWAPLILGVWAFGMWVFLRALGERSVIRTVRGVVPALYRRLAWAWAVAMVVPSVVLLDGDDAEPWTSALLQIMGRDEASAPWYHAFQAPVLAVAVGVALVAPVVGWFSARRDRVPPVD